MAGGFMGTPSALARRGATAWLGCWSGPLGHLQACEHVDVARRSADLGFPRASLALGCRRAAPHSPELALRIPFVPHAALVRIGIRRKQARRRPARCLAVEPAGG